MGELTIAKLNRLTTPGRHPDGDGLYLLVKESGRRSWVLRTTINGRRVDMGLGPFPGVGLAEAREKSTEARKVVRDGGNPLAEKKKVELTFEQGARAFYETIKGKFTSARHARQWITSLENDAFPKLGKRSMPSVTSVDILSILTPIWFAKPVAAKRLKQRLETIFDWAIPAGHYTSVNPVTVASGGLDKNNGKAVENYAAMNWRDLPKFYATVDHAILKLLILTCVRSSECREAQWSEFDFDARVWTIPASRLKMRNKSNKPHRVPLTDEMITILKALEAQKAEGAVYVFPSTRKKGTAPVAANYIIRLVEGDGFTVHGFRSTFRVWADEEAHADFQVAEAVLAHAIGDRTSQAYARSDLFERRCRLMEAWNKYVVSHGTV